MIRNINDSFGDPVEFESVEEMAQAILSMGYTIPDDGLKEGIDYEIIDN